ncbi:MAG: hypothetical protein ACNA7W_14855 [Pseudomonadales bacterium]
MDFLLASLVAIALLALAAPYVARIRHPEQRPFAAYLIFVTVFAAAAVVLFVLIGWLVNAFGLTQTLGPTGLMVLLVIFGLGPALAIATWQARKPPMRRGPPD